MATTAHETTPGGAATGEARPLHLTNPAMTGPDVTSAQELLTNNPFGNFNPGTIDGEYGPTTAAATRMAKLALGYPDDKIDQVFGPMLRAYLTATPLPDDYRARSDERKQTHGDLRTKIVEFARWGIANEAQIHYEQSRPVDGMGQLQKLPLNTDCSGFSTLCYKWAGAPDPNGGNFAGTIFTGTMLTACRRIPQAAVQPGDLVVFGTGSGHHVCLVLEAGADPLLCSHGQEKGPVAIPFSQESKFQPAPVTWLSILP